MYSSSLSGIQPFQEEREARETHLLSSKTILSYWHPACKIRLKNSFTMSIERYAENWMKIERGDRNQLNLTLHELSFFREQLSDRELGIFYFNRACYDSALIYLKKANCDEDIQLIRVCKSRLNQDKNEGESILDLDKIRPGLKAEIDKGEPKSLMEGRIGWYKNGKWTITNLNHRKIKSGIMELDEYLNGTCEVSLIDGRKVLLNRHGFELKELI